uniref:MI domain-containing protein n=1 Tax=Macrostomum lignano TaxID=282301 RepID=A0A1I8F5U4_9PLAT
MTAACRTTVLQLFKEKQIEKLSKFVADCSPDELQATMLEACGAPDFGHLAKAMFKGLELAHCDESAAAERRCGLVRAAVRVMARTEVSGPICSEAMSLLSIEVSNLSDSALVSVFDTLLDVTASDRIASPARAGGSSIARERDSLVRKSICCLRRVDISNLAGLLYHAFLFASKAGLLRLVICEVVEFFAELEGSNEKENSQERCLRSESVFLRSFPDPLSDASAAGAADADSEGSGSSSSHQRSDSVRL